MAKILNFGSLNIDYVYDVKGFVKAGETVSADSLEVFCGGKGLNQSIALSRAGAPVWHAGAIGEGGDDLVQVLEKNGVDTSLINKLAAPSGHAIIQNDVNGENCIIVFPGANSLITPEHINWALSGFGEGDYLILQNEINNTYRIIKEGKKKGMYIVLNPSPMNDEISKLPLDLVDLFMLNQTEALALSGEVEPKKSIEVIGKYFRTASVVVTLGERGSLYKASAQAIVSGCAYQVPVIDTTAAGDTFTGFFVASMAAGKTAEESLDIAARASAIAVSKKGAEPSIPTIEEVLGYRFVRKRG